MENQGLWKEEEKQEISIYKVVEIYDWHNDVPGTASTIFRCSESAKIYFDQRIKEIPYEMWGYSDDEMKRFGRVFEEPITGTTCITNDNDYVHLFIEHDFLHLLPISSAWCGD